MAQVTHVREFNGSSDEIELANTDFQAAPTDITVAAIITRAVDVSGFDWFWSIKPSADDSGYAGGIVSTGRTVLWAGSNGDQSADGYFTVAMSWCLIAFTKPDGASTVRTHRYRYDTQAWDHSDISAGSDIPAPGATATMWLGTYNGAGEFYQGKIACVGVWHTSALSDGALEGLTDSIADWEAASPTGLWLLNQTTVTDPVLDRVGAGDEIARNGTTVVAEAGLGFDVGGVYPVRSQYLDFDYSR